MPELNEYRFGTVSSVFIDGAGWFKPGDVVEGREVSSIQRINGRIYLLALDPTPNFVRSHALKVCLHINYGAPEEPADTVAGTGDDTVTG